MRSSTFDAFLVAGIIGQVYAVPSPPTYILKRNSSLAGREVIPSMNIVGFTDNNAMAAAAAAAPVFLFGQNRGMAPCYPESAVKLGSNPPEKNPGTDSFDFGPAGAAPGADCTGPGDYQEGGYNLGNPFPVYVSAKYCDSHQQWRVTYSVYWVHDGALSEGHRHDWESVTVAWKSSDGGTNWDRDALYLSQHSGYASYGWGDIISVDDPTDRSEDNGAYKAHPKVYVGFYKHPMFRNKETDVKVEILAPEAMANKEFRSDDWYYLPHDGDLHPGSQIGNWKAPGGIWDYGHANSDPWNIMQDTPPEGIKNVCSIGD